MTINNRTTYEKGVSNFCGIAIHSNVDEICCFEFVHWIKVKLGYDEVREIWFRKRGYSLHNGRKQIKSDAEIDEFLQAPENDGWFHLYVVHPQREEGISRSVFGAGCGGY